MLSLFPSNRQRRKSTSSRSPTTLSSSRGVQCPSPFSTKSARHWPTTSVRHIAQKAPTRPSAHLHLHHRQVSRTSFPPLANSSHPLPLKRNRLLVPALLLSQSLWIVYPLRPATERLALVPQGFAIAHQQKPRPRSEHHSLRMHPARWTRLLQTSLRPSYHPQSRRACRLALVPMFPSMDTCSLPHPISLRAATRSAPLLRALLSRRHAWRG